MTWRFLEEKKVFLETPFQEDRLGRGRLLLPRKRVSF